jgi:hypothetical protein
MRQVKETLSVKCFLTDEEKLKYGSEQSAANTKRHRLEDELKSFKKQKDSEIAQCEASENLNAKRVNNGYEYRGIVCDIIYEFDKKLKMWIRPDTGEIVKEDIINEDELQEEVGI